MKKINENKLAKEITKIEGQRLQVNIAQIKEIMAITFDILANNYDMSAVVELMEKHSDE